MYATSLFQIVWYFTSVRSIRTGKNASLFSQPQTKMLGCQVIVTGYVAVSFRLHQLARSHHLSCSHLFLHMENLSIII